ncbi:MAG: hypothetical protein E4H44_00135 [Candidatus Aminicenantes bacterium]|nr:MAG: hypothetical protein E4H44_00135 [Candidatus Aminicenantes bacterium]
MTEIIDKRLKTLNSVLLNTEDQEAVKNEFLDANGDWTKASAKLKYKLLEETFQKASFAYSLADWSNEHVNIVKALAEQPDLTSMLDVTRILNNLPKKNRNDLKFNTGRSKSALILADLTTAAASTIISLFFNTTPLLLVAVAKKVWDCSVAVSFQGLNLSLTGKTGGRRQCGTDLHYLMKINGR